MGPIKGVLREELANSLRMKADYERELAKIPKGSLIRKRVKGRYYYYLVAREKGVVKFVYKGANVPAAAVEQNRSAKVYRAKYRKLLSQVKKQIKFLKGALRGKQPI